VRKDWEQIQRRDHERAAKLGGETAPRGSGLPGDPALGGIGGGSSSAFAAPASSNWSGNPAVFVREPSGSMGGSGSASATKSAPTFTQPKVQAAPKSPDGFQPQASAATAVLARPAPPISAQSSPAKSNSPYAGASLSPNEILKLMEHAGAGCPLGPLQGLSPPRRRDQRLHGVSDAPRTPTPDPTHQHGN
jgi:hypothetical protein